MSDPYSVLGLRRSASDADIKTAYRKLARKLHPDVNSDPDAVERFKRVAAAYEVLQDPDSRQFVDLTGPEDFFQEPTPTGESSAVRDVDFGFVCSRVRESLRSEMTSYSRKGQVLRSRVFEMAADILSKSLADYDAALRKGARVAPRPTVLSVAERFLRTIDPEAEIEDRRSEGHLISGFLGIVGLTRVARIVGRDATPRAKEAAARSVMSALSSAFLEAGLIGHAPADLSSDASLSKMSAVASDAYAELEEAVAAGNPR